MTENQADGRRERIYRTAIAKEEERMKNYFTDGISKGVSQTRVAEFMRKTKEPEKRVFLQDVISKIVYIGGIAFVLLIFIL